MHGTTTTKIICYLLHPVGLEFITLPTLKMHGQTQIKSRNYVRFNGRFFWNNGLLGVDIFTK
jgi:hypothetical protein